MPDDDDPDAPVKLNDLDYQRVSNAVKKAAPPTAAMVDLFRAHPAAEGADLDCWSPAAPAALALLAESPGVSPAIAAAIARGRARPHVIVLGDRPEKVGLDLETFEIGPLQSLVPYRRVACTPPTEAPPRTVRVDGAPLNWCGLCGKTFRIAPDDPHWSTGRGPICPTPKAKP